MTTISNFMSTLATPASLAGSFARTGLVLMAASFVVWDERWAFTIPPRITLRMWRLGEVDLRATAFRSSVASVSEGEETSTVPVPQSQESSFNGQNPAGPESTGLKPRHYMAG